MFPKTQILGEQSDRITSQSKTFNYQARFCYEQDDPSKYDIIKNDDFLAYFKFERKTNYKQGIYDTMGLFENRFNFVQFYRVFMCQGSFIYKQIETINLAKNSFVEDIKEQVSFTPFLENSKKNQIQFLEDVSSSNHNAQTCFNQVITIAQSLQYLSLKFLSIKKEDRPGPEVALEILASCSSDVSSLSSLLSDCVITWKTSSCNEI